MAAVAGARFKAIVLQQFDPEYQDYEVNNTRDLLGDYGELFDGPK